MDKRRIEQYKNRLLEKQEELRQLVVKSEQDGREADEAANSYAKEFLFHQSDDQRRILQLVEEALHRIAKGDFGSCVACEKDVQKKRLKAVPWARHCIGCQEKQEQGLL